MSRETLFDFQEDLEKRASHPIKTIFYFFTWKFIMYCEVKAQRRKEFRKFFHGIILSRCLLELPVTKNRAERRTFYPSTRKILIARI